MSAAFTYLQEDDLYRYYQQPLLEELIGGDYSLLALHESTAIATIRAAVGSLYNIDEVLIDNPRDALFTSWVAKLTIYESMLRLHPSQVSPVWRDYYKEVHYYLDEASKGNRSLAWPRVEDKTGDRTGIVYGSRFEKRNLGWH